MTQSFTGKKRIRKTFGRIPEVAPMPNLIEVQKSSYDHFLQMGVPAHQRADLGLQEVFKSVFPIKDFSDRAPVSSSTSQTTRRSVTFSGAAKVMPRCWHSSTSYFGCSSS